MNSSLILKMAGGAVLVFAIAPAAASVKVQVDLDSVKTQIAPNIYGTGMEDVNHEIYGGLDAQRLFGESFEEAPHVANGGDHCVSAQWVKVAALDGGDFLWDRGVKHWGKASQLLLPNGGVAAIANRGLNGWGVPCVQGRAMRGYVYTRGKVEQLEVELRSVDGVKAYAAAVLETQPGDDWHQLQFTLAPQASDAHAQLVIRASGEGRVWLDDVYLADEPTNEFGRLGCREDIVAAFQREGVNFLRWGGSMVNTVEYRLRNMHGERTPYRGHWYPESSGGFGVREFVAMAAAMKLPCAFCISDAESVSAARELATWLKRFDIPLYVEIGNEEVIWGDYHEDQYWLYTTRCRMLVEAMRAENPKLKFVTAAWWRWERLDLMEGHFRALEGYIDYWDLHPFFNSVGEARRARRLVPRVMAQLRQWNPNTTMKVAVFEENGSKHSLERALCHAVMLETVREMGNDILTSSPANALQPYLHNDNWWDQGSVFFTTDQVWLQPCGYAQQMASANHRELLVASKVESDEVSLSATRNAKGDSAVLHLVNPVAEACGIDLQVTGAARRIKRVLTLTGAKLAADNPPDDPERISPKDITADFVRDHRLPTLSYTIIELVP